MQMIYLIFMLLIGRGGNVEISGLKLPIRTFTSNLLTVMWLWSSSSHHLLPRNFFFLSLLGNFWEAIKDPRDFFDFLSFHRSAPSVRAGIDNALAVCRQSGRHVSDLISSHIELVWLKGRNDPIKRLLIAPSGICHRAALSTGQQLSTCLWNYCVGTWSVFNI